VLDASVLVKWIKDVGEADVPAARAVQDQYRRGELGVVMPYLVFLEVINAAVRRWGWSHDQLQGMVRVLLEARFRIEQPPPERVAYWAGRGLTAYDACYVALAEARRTVVITADERILTVAGDLAEPLGGPLDDGERSLAAISAWGPAEDWADWAHAAR
jgi:predicted nucleic acid-binding protein